MTPLSRAQIEELLGAYAVDALDGTERVEVAAAVADDPTLATEVAGYHEALAALSAEPTDEASLEALPRVWDRIQDTIAPAVPPAQQRSTGAKVIDIFRKRNSTFTLMAVAAVAALVALSAALGIRVIQQDGRIDELQSALSGVQGRTAAEVLADPASTIAVLTAPGADVEVARIAVAPDGTGYLVSDNLAGLDDSQTYQLWAIYPEAIISAGLLGSDPDVVPFRVDDGVLGYAITAEVSGGVVASEQDPVAVWLPDA